MLNVENFNNARWGEFYAFFANGNPPLAFQLLILNTIFLGFVVYRRAKGKFRMRKSSVLFIQGVLIATNMIIMFQKETYSAAMAVKHFI
jgi:uncharacterized protein YegP (UPF0339 family)